jgi:hypothetical protein
LVQVGSAILIILIWKFITRKTSSDIIQS